MKERLGIKVERLTRELYKARRELRRTKDELSEVMRDLQTFLSPPDGECSDKAFYTRCVCHGQVEMECPFIMCKLWFDNPAYMNCERYMQQEGLTEEELAQVDNVFKDGKLGAAYIKKVEERAVGKLKDGVLNRTHSSRDGPYTRYVDILFGLDSKEWQQIKRRMEIEGEDGGGMAELIKERKREEQNGRRNKRQRRTGNKSAAAANP